jgi:PKD repeat protein
VNQEYRWVLTNATTNAVVWAQTFSTTAQPGPGLLNALTNTSNTNTLVYRLKLVARAGGSGQCADSTSKQITVLPKPDAVIAPISNICAGSTLPLQSNSLGTGLSYQWTYYLGNSATGTPRTAWINTSSIQNPTLNFPQWNHPAADSTYTIKLRITNEYNCVDSAVRTVTVYTRPTVTIIPVSAQCGSISAGRSASIGGPSNRNYTYSWSILTGGGSVSAVTNSTPTQYMPPATQDSLMHVVKLIVTDQFLCSSEYTDTTWTRARPQANFSTGSNYCDSSLAIIQNTGISRLTSDTTLTHQWLLTRGPWSTTYTGKNPSILLRNRGFQDSTYTLRLITTNSLNCSDTIPQTITVRPDAKVTLNSGALTACTPFVLDSNIVKAQNYPSANGLYTWKIFDSNGVLIKFGIGRSTLSDTVTTPSTTWTIRFIAAPLATGCKSDSAQVQVTTVPNPLPFFSFVDESICLGSDLVIDSVGPAGMEYRWVLKDAAQSTVLWTRNYSATAQPGTGLNTALTNSGTTTRQFQLKLITRVGGLGGCLDSLEKRIWLYPRPVADFDSISNSCSDTLITVLDQSGLASQRQYQLYARINGQWHERSARIAGATTPTPTLNFGSWKFSANATDSLYTLKLLVVSDSLCSDSTTQNFTIYARPSVDIDSLASQCGPFSSVLNANVTNPAGRLPTFTWSLSPSSGQLSSFVATNPTLNLPTPQVGSQTYRVRLNVLDQFSCGTSDSIEVTVWARPEANFNAMDTVCANSVFTPQNISASNITDTTLNYSWTIYRGSSIWNSGVTQRSPSWNLTNSGTADSVYQVQLIATNTFGCTDTSVQTVRVHPDARAELVTNNLIDCAPFVIDSTRITSALHPNANGLYTWKTFNAAGQIRRISNGPGSLRDTIKSANDSVLVRLTATSLFNCKSDSVEVWVKTLPNPDASFNLAPNDTVCHATAISASALNPSAGYSYAWLLRRPGTLQFALLASGTNLTPTILTNTGTIDSTYELKLRAVNLNSGCADSISQNIQVQPNPIPSIQNSVSCGLDTVQLSGSAFAGSVNADNLVTSWVWTIQNQTLSGQNINYFFGVAGQYPVRLQTSTSNGCDTAVWDTVTVYDYPIADFQTASSCGIDTVCLGVAFNVSSTSIGNPLSGLITSYAYDFGADGSIEYNTSNFTHTATTPGALNLKLSIETEWGCRDSITRQLWVLALPTVAINFVADSTCGPVIPLYTHSDSGLVDSTVFELYAMQAGTKVTVATSTTPWPNLPLLQPNYRSDTTYYLSKTVFNCCGFITALDSIVVKTPPVADFALLPDSGCTPMNVLIQLDGLITGDADSASIDFGDGTTGSYTPNRILQNGNFVYQWGQKNHTFSYNGFNDTTYLITLTVFNECGDSSLTKTVYLQPNTIQAFLQSNATEGCAPLTVNFTNLSFNALNDNWCFNWNSAAQTCGGMSSTQSNPTWTFTQAGVYTVALFVDNGCGYDTAFTTITVFPAPVASASNNGPTCANDSIQFTGTASLSSGWVAGWRWEFGDGDTSALQNPIHAYDSSGTYTAKLIVTSSNGCQDSAFTTVTVLATPDVEFSALNACFNEQPIMFTNTSTAGSGTIVGTAWYFGDGNTSTALNPSHSYSAPGTYTAKLVHTTSTGCSDSATQIVLVYPTPSLSMQPVLVAGDSCSVPQTYQFNNFSTGTIGVFWDFNYAGNPGIDTSRLVSPSFTFTQAGIYTVALIGESAFGCTDTLFRQILVRDGVTAGIDVQPLSGCAPLEIRATNLSQFNASLDTLIGLTWDFGDGTVLLDTTQSQFHTYGTAGTYVVTLTALMASGCADVVVSQPVTVHPTPQAGFRIDRINLRTRQMVNLTVTSDPNTTYIWHFGDGTTSTEFEPEHVYDPNRSGLDSLNVCLIATNSFGCSDSVCTSLWLWPAQLDVPNALAPDINYAGEDAVFLPKGHSLMEYELTIFDKWGNIVFTTTALDANGIPSEAWNGRLNNIGNPLPMGAYVWKIVAVFDDGTSWLTERTKIGKRDYGTVTLIR